MLQRYKLQDEPLSRYYYAYVPPGERLPLVLAFHGGGSTPLDMARFSQLTQVAEQQRFAVVFPSGSGPWPEYLTWNAGICCGHASRRNIDDVGFVGRLLDRLLDQFPIDPSRVYATGMSNGGMFSYRLAAEMPHRFAAIAPVAGCLSIDPPRLPRAVPALHIHGTADHFVPYQGGGGKRSLRQIQFPSVAESLTRWSAACGLEAAEPEYREYPYDRTLANDEPLAAHRAVYATVDGVDQVVEIRVSGGGHTWPGSAPLWCFLGPTLLGLPAGEVIWRFFEQFFCTARSSK
ncbi:alpha/beta hydrolase family esterase [Aeoliella mucimassa]|uniref:Poly(3-hydroxyoctanoate) depolymerase n=1 Tax=Aeoliella mucimassa TaxID=2527972 RepID=A0A518AR37_9BACT|nr:PHB depolymerase family esterase [Aeoliella mucimassa]QDU57183.1 Poly(3-hydroxyoctanoate) depolymerase precursor [Aeoliella mucimassa]